MTAYRLLPAAALGLGLALLAGTTAPARATTQKWYERAVKRVSATISPAEARPGQTVTFSLTVELNEGYHTYPTVQPDKAAAAMVNVIRFPEPGVLVFVGELQDPPRPKIKADPEAGIHELRYYPGTVTFTRKAVVSPDAAPGPVTIKLPAFKLSVCDAERCYPAKDVPVEVPFRVLEGPAETVDPAYANEVRKALGK